MANYSVDVEVKGTWEDVATYDVEADSEEDAREQALALAYDDTSFPDGMAEDAQVVSIEKSAFDNDDEDDDYFDEEETEEYDESIDI